MDIQRFTDYQKAVEFMLKKQNKGEVWLMSVELIENRKIYTLTPKENKKEVLI